jgi:hypothetical protein
MMDEYQKEVYKLKNAEELKLRKKYKEDLGKSNPTPAKLLDTAARALARGDMLNSEFINAKAESTFYKGFAAAWLSGVDPKTLIAMLDKTLTVGQATINGVAICLDEERRAPLRKNQQKGTKTNAERADARRAVLLELACMKDPAGKLSDLELAEKVLKILHKDPRFTTVFNSKTPSLERTRIILAKRNQK